MKVSTDLKCRKIQKVPWGGADGSSESGWPYQWEESRDASDRVRKLMVSTIIGETKLKSMDYKFHYSHEENFADWFKDCYEKGLI